MEYRNLFDIAVRNGWRVFHKEQDGIWIVEFRRKTFSGVPFCFTVEMEYGKVENLVSEIISFADAIDPETCAVEWMILSGAVSPSCYQQAVADMDNIRVEVWLLVYDLLGLIGSSNASLQFPNNELRGMQTASWNIIFPFAPSFGKSIGFIGYQIPSLE